MGNSDWQDKLRTGMEGFSEPVPDTVWKAVSSGVSDVWDRQRRAVRRRRLFAVSSAFAAAVLAAVLVVPGIPDKSLQVSAGGGGLLAAALEAGPEESLFPIPEAEELRELHRTLRVPEPSAAYSTGDEENPSAVPSGTAESARQEMPAEKEDAGSAAPDSESGRPDPDAAWKEGMVDFPAAFPDASDDRRGRRPGISLNFRASNLAPGSSETMGYGGLYGSVVAPALTSHREQAGSYSSVLLGNNSREVSTDTRHWQPVSLGVTASLDLYDFLAFETGLNYSCLISDMSSGTDENHYDIRQTLHYVGIPFRARFSVWRPGNFELYLSAGAEVEKCVYGTATTTYVVNSSASSRASTRVDDSKLQWSAGASAGFGYRINDFLGVYAEPGVCWYFSNGGFVENVYRDRPFNFSIALGLRFYISSR